MTLTIGSLFSGIIGGLELGLERAGLGPVLFQVESDPYCLMVLEKHWPTVPRFADVRSVGSELPRPDILCGGFPCQGNSSAGKGLGLKDPRSALWYEFRRIAEALSPAVVVVENVASGARRWLPHVRRDLHVLGYRTRAFQLSAEEVGAPHERARIFVVAHADGTRLEERCKQQAWRQRAAAQRSGVPDDPWAAEPGVGRVAHGVPHRVDRIRALGNAVVPQCAETIGRVIAATIVNRKPRGCVKTRGGT